MGCINTSQRAKKKKQTDIVQINELNDNEELASDVEKAKHEKALHVVNIHRQCKTSRKLMKLDRNVQNGFGKQFQQKKTNNKQRRLEHF